jgi:hypothetical protein
VTPTETVLVCVSKPLVPVMGNVVLPTGVLEVVVIVSIEVALPLIEAGLNVAVVPVGSPLTLKPIEPVKPLIAVVLTV